MILKRYSSLDYIFSLEINEALSHIDFLFEKQEEELIFQRWINGPQFYMSLEAFKEKLQPIELRDEEEILDEVYEIIKMFN